MPARLHHASGEFGTYMQLPKFSLVCLSELSLVPYLPIYSNAWKVGSIRGFLLEAWNLDLGIWIFPHLGFHV